MLGNVRRQDCGTTRARDASGHHTNKIHPTYLSELNLFFLEDSELDRTGCRGREEFGKQHNGPSGARGNVDKGVERDGAGFGWVGLRSGKPTSVARR
jgi:hypothetical protein